MLVRCGRCRAELEVSGPGEFVCPACGTRNAVRGTGAPGANPFGLPDIGGPPSPFSSPPPAPSEPAPGVSWVVCPSCSYRFAVGEVQQVACPVCATTIELADDDAGPGHGGGQGNEPSAANP